MAPKQGSASEKVNLEYGICFHCQRIMPIKYLKQICYYEGHLIKGKHHHKLMCKACLKAADQIEC